MANPIAPTPLLLPAFLAFTAAVLPPNASIGQDAGFGHDADVRVRRTLLPAERHPSIRAAGEADRLPRVRRALAARQGDQPDGRAGARHGARHADPRAGRPARDRHRPRLPRLLGVGEDLAHFGTAGGWLQGARYRACGHADGLFRAVRARRAVRRYGDRLTQRQWLDR